MRITVQAVSRPSGDEDGGKRIRCRVPNVSATSARPLFHRQVALDRN